MGSTEPDRSLSSGVTIPQWMKQKVGDRYDFDDTAFSPPSYDDNFFYIRYPKQVKKVKEKSKYNSINEFLEAKERISKEESDQHTSACRRFMPEGGMRPGFESDHDPAVASLRRKGPPALEGGYQPEMDQSCGQSVVQVAQQMTGQLAGTVIQSGIRGYVDQPPRLRERRGSKSLPASPLATPQTSPKSVRRVPAAVSHNRYFTPAMIVASQGEASGGFSRGSILSRLLGAEAAKNRLYSEESDEGAEEGAAGLASEGRVAELRRNKSTSALLAKAMDRPTEESRMSPPPEAIAESLVHKFVVLAALLAVANAGFIGAPAAIAYGAPSVAVATPAITSQHQNTLRSYGNLGQVSTYSKSIDTPYSSVRKSDVRVSNDALAYAAAPAYASYAAPAYHGAYAAPAVAAYHAAPAVAAYHAPVAAYAAPAAYHGSVVAKTGLLGVAYSAAPAVTHLSFDGYGVHYGY